MAPYLLKSFHAFMSNAVYNKGNNKNFGKRRFCHFLATFLLNSI